MKSLIKCSLIVPCFNEYESLLHLLPEVKKYTDDYPLEFIFIDNGSSDSSWELLNENRNEKILAMRLESNLGYGGGIKSGLKISRGKYVGWIHADLQYTLSDVIEHLALNLAPNNFLKGRRKNRRIGQKLISLSMSVFESLLFQRFFSDINAQPTIFDRNLIADFNSLPDDFSIDLFVYAIAKKKRFKIERFSVKYAERSFGTSSWNSGFKSVLKISLRTIKYSLFLRVNYDNY
jgi:glycosyltransferase involved in cell wall biosynthesis